jgi:chemotaxis protein MotB
LARVRRARSVDYWPGFVDALSTMLIIVLFVLMVFTLAQLFLSQILAGRNEALASLNRQVAELADLLKMEQARSSDLQKTIGALSAQLQASTEQRDRLSAQLSDAQSALTAARGLSGNAQAELESERRVSAQAKAQVDLLNQQIAALRAELARIAKVLEASEAKEKEQQVQIAALGERLNRALASKVEELARYRSEFFGRLREVLGNRPDIRIVGDRFVFQSDVVFESASAELSPAGQAQIEGLAATLKEISAKIPKELNWVLRVDGHTDRRPFRAGSAQFPSNWELSAARAISVVKFLIAQGIPADRLAATGFGEYQPLDEGNTEDALRKNRRIELKLTER